MVIDEALARLAERIAAEVWTEVMGKVSQAFAAVGSKLGVPHQGRGRRRPRKPPPRPSLTLVPAELLPAPANDCRPEPPEASPPPAAGDRHELVLRYMPLAQGIARRRHLKCRDADYGDFEGAAMEGLVQAAERWDGVRPFPGYAEWRITGAIKDWQRTTWRVGTRGSMRYQARKARDAGAEPPRPEITNLPGLVRKAEKHGQPIPEALRFHDRGYADTETRLTLEALIARAGLTEQERFVITRRMAGRRHKDIARELGFTESRSCQIEAAAIKAMTAVAEDDEPDVAVA